MTSKIRRAVCAVVFISILAGFFYCATYVVSLKKSRQKLTRFFEASEQTDVLFFGVSHVEYGIYPLELWQDHGMTAYNMGCAGNTIPTIYWVMRNALDYTDPKVVVMDCTRSDVNYKGVSDLALETFDLFPLSRTKYEMAMDLEEDWTVRAGLLFPIVKYHSRWNELTKDDFGYYKPYMDNGAYHDTIEEMFVSEPELHEETSEDAKTEPADLSEYYIRKSIEMCQERGITILLTNLPFPAKADRQMYANAIKDIADEYGVDYLDFSHIPGVVDYTIDMKDLRGHLNEAGARKTTEYIGDFINANYHLEDHRNDPAYTNWTEYWDKYYTYKTGRIVQQPELDVYLSQLADWNYSSMIYVREDSPVLQDERMLKLLRNTLRHRADVSAKRANEAYTVSSDIVPQDITGGVLFVTDNPSGSFEAYTPTKEGISIELDGRKVSFGLKENGKASLMVDGVEQDILEDTLDAKENPWDVKTYVIDSTNGDYVHMGEFTVEQPEKAKPLTAVKY